MAQIELEIKQLKDEVIDMWMLVRSQIFNAKMAIINFDKDLAREIVHKEKRVNGYELKIDNDCEDIFALRTPVAIDLRFVLAVLKINNSLERIGDLADGIAKHIINSEKPFSQELLTTLKIVEMMDIALEILDDAEIAFENEDTTLARTIFERDEYLDKINNTAVETTAKFISEKSEEMHPALYMMSVIRKLERIGDQTKNIAEEIIFYIEAKVLKHKHNKKKIKRPDAE